MKLWDILKTVGGTALQIALPGTGSVIVGAINELLPDNRKLPAGANGDDINSVISKLPAEQQASLLEKEFDVKITQIQESHSTVRKMLESDVQNPHTTRPYIAKGSFLVVAFVILSTTCVWSYAVISNNHELVKIVMNGWQFQLAAIGPLVTLLWAYFGVLKQEHKTKLDAANGFSTGGGILSKILKR